MERRKFVKSCCYSSLGLSLIALNLQSCKGIYYATVIRHNNKLLVNKSEFWMIKKDKKVIRSFVLVKPNGLSFPICLYKTNEDSYVASLLQCTHRSCELNVGGGIYSCPCHGSEFSVHGKVLEGPAIKDLKIFKTDIENENINIYLS